MVPTKINKMTPKEIILAIVVCLSLFLYVRALFIIEKLPLDKEQKYFYRFISFVIPFAGYFVVIRKAKSYKHNSKKVID